MPLPVSFLSYTLNDYTLKKNGEPESTNFNFPIITIDETNQDDVAALVTAFTLSVTALTNGVLNKIETTLSRQTIDVGPAASPLTQRENKWLVRGHDNTSRQKWSFSMGTADLSLLVGNAEFLVITSGVGATFKTNLEALMVSPFDSAHTVVVDSVQFVGRNT